MLTATETPLLQRFFHMTLAGFTILILVKLLQKFREKQSSELLIQKQLLDLNNTVHRTPPIDDHYFRPKQHPQQQQQN